MHRPAEVALRAEVAEIRLAVDRVIEPLLGLGDDSLIVQDEAERGEAPEPVGHFLPPGVSEALGAQPGVVVLIAVRADLDQMAGKAVRLEFELLSEPSPRFDRTEREVHKRAREQRLTVSGVVAVWLGDIGFVDNLDADRLSGGRQCEGAEHAHAEHPDADAKFHWLGSFPE
jgi:hypothetical protein